MPADTNRPQHSFRISSQHGSSSGSVQHTWAIVHDGKKAGGKKANLGLKHLLSDVFLPAGYPSSVSPDYMHYQVFNALQAFCSSLSGLIASRAVLEGFGVGDASASATSAMLLTVLQEVFSRCATIVGAYYFGTSLSPEAKTYKLLADVLNDVAIALDTLSPFFTAFAIPLPSVVLGAQSISLRVIALCITGACRALCGVCAGGSKAALTVHFASTSKGTADVGDLNAKDASKETVLGLLGMLTGTIVIPRLTTPQATYTALFMLVLGHLAFNVIALRGVSIPALNRQRASLAWGTFRSSSAKAPTPDQVSTREGLFASPQVIRTHEGRRVGQCALAVGVAPPPSTPTASAQVRILQLLDNRRFSVWLDSAHPTRVPLSLSLSFKRGYSQDDLLQGWLYAAEFCRSWSRTTIRTPTALPEVAEASLKSMESSYEPFKTAMEKAGWRLGDGLLIPGSPPVADIVLGSGQPGELAEEKKTR